VTVPSGVAVLPGRNVTTQAEASNPALGKVVPAAPAELAAIRNLLTNSGRLRQGYATLYAGQSNTGVPNPRVAPGYFNGDLAVIKGTSREPGPQLVPGEPGNLGPTFLSARNRPVTWTVADFPARIVGGVAFDQRPYAVAHRMGRRNAIRADIGQPFRFGSIDRTGDDLVVNAPLGGSITVGLSFRAGARVVLLGAPGSVTTLGDRVSLGDGAVVEGSRIGSGASIGARSYIVDSDIPAGAVIAPGTILIRNQPGGLVEW
jgi:hypothetical protein